MSELLNKIKKYIEFEERINELLASLNTIKGKLRERRIVKDIGELEDSCDLFYQQIQEDIDKLGEDDSIVLKKTLDDKINLIEKETDELYLRADNTSDKKEISVILDKISKIQEKENYYYQILNYLIHKNNVKKISYVLDYDE